MRSAAGGATIADRFKLEPTAPDCVAVAFDLRAPTFRHALYEGYKAGRKGMPPELAEQMDPLKGLLAEMGVTAVSKETFEADDILGTLARVARERGDRCFIATGDRDALQLVGGGVTVLLAATKMGRPEIVTYDEAAIINIDDDIDDIDSVVDEDDDMEDADLSNLLKSVDSDDAAAEKYNEEDDIMIKKERQF